MIDYLDKQNILNMDTEALVNTVNCVGIMGKGLALQFKQKYPENYKKYNNACKRGEVRLGKMFIFHTNSLLNPKYIINFPTKYHWKEKSKLENIENGLKDLVEQIKNLSISSISIPPLGCGNGGLSWKTVCPIMEKYLVSLPEIGIKIITPLSEKEFFPLQNSSSMSKMTEVRALLILAINNYLLQGYELTLLEIQKLAYFLTVLGVPTKLEFEQGYYGPYADKLNKVLEKLEGSYIQGYTGSRSPTAEIKLLPEGIQEAQKFLQENNNCEINNLLKSMKEIISGFENVYGMEILATVHWAVKNNPSIVHNSQEVIKATQWNSRKSNILQPDHIIKTLEHLQSLNLV